MMDLSDGLAKDLGSLTPSGLAPALCAPAIPLSAAARRLARRTGRPALTHALSDGEDFELLLVTDRRSDAGAFERAWRKHFPRLPLTQIGVFAPERNLPPGSLRLSDYHGYEHLR